MSSKSILREARHRAGFTQEDLANLVETTQSAIARWEGGRVEPSFETLRRLVAACGLDLVISLRELDEGQLSLIEANLQLTPEQRFDQLVRTLSFIEAGRAALGNTGG